MIFDCSSYKCIVPNCWVIVELLEEENPYTRDACASAVCIAICMHIKGNRWGRPPIRKTVQGA